MRYATAFDEGKFHLAGFLDHKRNVLPAVVEGMKTDLASGHGAVPYLLSVWVSFTSHEGRGDGN